MTRSMPQSKRDFARSRFRKDPSLPQCVLQTVQLTGVAPRIRNDDLQITIVGKTPKSAQRSTQGKKVDGEILPTKEWFRLRSKIISHFSANPQESYWLADLVRVLNVEPASPRSVLNDVKKEGIAEEYHPGLWRFKKS